MRHVRNKAALPVFFRLRPSIRCILFRLLSGNTASSRTRSVQVAEINSDRVNSAQTSTEQQTTSDRRMRLILNHVLF